MSQEDLRRSKRMTCGSIGWVDSTPCLSTDEILENIIQSNQEWNLYVFNYKDIRHAFVIQKDFHLKSFLFYDYQGGSFLEDQIFPTTIVFETLKNSICKTLGFKCKLGQHHEVGEGKEYTHLCLKNSAFVMEHHCAPADSKFNKPFVTKSKANNHKLHVISTPAITVIDLVDENTSGTKTRSSSSTSQSDSTTVIDDDTTPEKLSIDQRNNKKRKQF